METQLCKNGKTSFIWMKATSDLTLNTLDTQEQIPYCHSLHLSDFHSQHDTTIPPHNSHIQPTEYYHPPFQQHAQNPLFFSQLVHMVGGDRTKVTFPIPFYQNVGLCCPSAQSLSYVLWNFAWVIDTAMHCPHNVSRLTTCWSSTEMQGQHTFQLCTVLWGLPNRRNCKKYSLQIFMFLLAIFFKILPQVGFTVVERGKKKIMPS